MWQLDEFCRLDARQNAMLDRARFDGTEMVGMCNQGTLISEEWIPANEDCGFLVPKSSLN